MSEGKIYVVIGQTGEYSDHREWPVKAFLSKEKAESFVVKAKQEYHRIAEEMRSKGIKYYDDEAQAIIDTGCDPGMKIDYTGVEYYYWEVAVET